MLQQWRRQQYLQRAGARAMMSSVSQKHPIIWNVFVILGLTGSSAGKESACNAGDPGLILGTGRSAGEGISYALQYSWASLVAQTIKNLPAMWETWVQFLGWEDPLEKGMVTCYSTLTSRPKEPGRLQSMGSQRVGHDWATFTCFFTILTGVNLLSFIFFFLLSFKIRPC